MARSKSKNKNKNSKRKGKKGTPRHPRRKPSPRREFQVLDELLGFIFHQTGGDLTALPEALWAPVLEAELCLVQGVRPGPDDWSAVLTALAALEDEEGFEGLVRPVVRRAESEGRQLTAADAFEVMEQVRHIRRELRALMGDELFDLAAALCSPEVSPSEAVASARLILEQHGA